MANDDKNKDKEQDDFFGDDEDFGLPELDYEALDDDDETEEVSAIEEELEAEETGEAAEKEVLSEDSGTDEENDLGEPLDEEEIPDQISDDELEASLDEISDEAMDEFYEEESFDDFEATEGEEESSEDIPDSVFDSDVLDEDEFAQFEKELMETEEEDISDISTFQSPADSAAKGKSKSKFTRVVIFGIVIFAALGTAFWLMAPLSGESDGQTKPVAEKTTKKPVVKKPVEKKPEETKKEEPVNNAKGSGSNSSATTKKATQPPAKKPVQKPTNSRPKVAAATPGTVNELAGKTGNMYIIIGSFLDRDMAMDYANELAGKGKSPYVIPPFGKAVTHRVAIAAFGSFAEAQGALVGFKPEFGDDIWILRY